MIKHYGRLQMISPSLVMDPLLVLITEIQSSAKVNNDELASKSASELFKVVRSLVRFSSMVMPLPSSKSQAIGVSHSFRFAPSQCHIERKTSAAVSEMRRSHTQAYFKAS